MIESPHLEVRGETLATFISIRNVPTDRKPPMPQKPKPKPDDPEQSKCFIQAAREAEADETEKGADRAFKKAVKPTHRSDTD